MGIPRLVDTLGPVGRHCGQFIQVVEMVRAEKVLVPFRRLGRHREDRTGIARAFFAKAVFDIATTKSLVERLKHDWILRRLCGWTFQSQVPSESTFLCTYAMFAETDLRQLPVQGQAKAVCHLLFGVLAPAADQIMRQQN